MNVKVKNNVTKIRLEKRERQHIRNAVILLATLSHHDIGNQSKLESAINAIEDAMEAYSDSEVPAV